MLSEAEVVLYLGDKSEAVPIDYIGWFSQVLAG